jgi:hypothetical protein
MTRLAHPDPTHIPEDVQDRVLPLRHVHMVWSRVTGRDGRARLVCGWAPAGASAVK